MIIPKDDVWSIMSRLGETGNLQVVDLNKGEQPHHLRFFNYVKRAEEIEKVLM